MRFVTKKGCFKFFIGYIIHFTSKKKLLINGKEMITYKNNYTIIQVQANIILGLQFKKIFFFNFKKFNT